MVGQKQNGSRKKTTTSPRSPEDSLLSVELLDDDATPHMQIWHRAKLADALGLAGSMDAARLRYAQTEELCIALDQPKLLLGLLNNYASPAG